MIKNLVLMLVVLASSLGFAQRSDYYKPSIPSTTGLVVKLDGGSVYCNGGDVVSYAGGTVALQPDAINYIYLDSAQLCVPTANTTGFPTSTIPIAKVNTSGSLITNLTDLRGLSHPSGSSSGGLSGGVNTRMGYWLGASTLGNDADLTYNSITHVHNFGGQVNFGTGASAGLWDFFGSATDPALSATGYIGFLGPSSPVVTSQRIRLPNSLQAGVMSLGTQVGTELPLTLNPFLPANLGGTGVTDFGFSDPAQHTAVSTDGSLTNNALHKTSSTGGAVNAGVNDDGTTVSLNNEPFSFADQAGLIAVPNCSGTGTTINKIAKRSFNGTAFCATIATVSDTTGLLGVVAGGAGTTGSALIAVAGQWPCIFDNSSAVVTVNDKVVNSPTINGACHDYGSAVPANTQLVGIVNAGVAAASNSLLNIRPSGSELGGLTPDQLGNPLNNVNWASQGFDPNTLAGYNFSVQAGVGQGATTGTWSVVQHAEVASCAGTVTTCNVTFGSNVTAGNAVIVYASIQGASNALTTPSGAGGGTWVVPSNCSVFDGAIGNIGIGYVLNATGGSAVVTVNWTTARSAVTAGAIEVHSTAGVPIFDSPCATKDQTTSATSITNNNFSGLAGTNDFMLQLIRAGNTISSVASPYNTSPSPVITSGITAAAWNLNTASLTAPQWTALSARAGLIGIALREPISLPGSPGYYQAAGSSAVSGSNGGAGGSFTGGGGVGGNAGSGTNANGGAGGDAILSPGAGGLKDGSGANGAAGSAHITAPNSGLRIDGNTSGYAGWKSPAAGPSVLWILPTADAVGLWHSDGAGNTSISTAVAADIASGAVTNVKLGANAVDSPKMAVVNTRRTCMIDVGADNAAAVLVDGDLGPQKRRCFINAASTIVEVTVSADGGTPNVLLQRRRGASTVADLLSAALATASSGAVACAMASTSGTCIDGTTSSGTITLSNTALNAGDYVELKSGTAGGTAKSMQVAVTFTVN